MKSGPVRIAVCTAALLIFLAALSRAPYTPRGAEAALLRFSWRMSVTARENCRPRTEAELAVLPVHMRTPEVCTGDRATYFLLIRIDSAAPDTVQLSRGGMKGDRPLFVLEERGLTPGRHRVRVGVHRSGETGPDELLASLDTVLTLRPSGVQLVTLGTDGRSLTVASSPAR